MEKKQKLIIGLVTALLIVIGIGASYAFFTAGIAGSESSSTIKARAGEMTINYNGGANLEVSGIYPSDTPWITKNFTVTGKNTTELVMYYKVRLIVDENAFSNNEITYSLASTVPEMGSIIAPQEDVYINGTNAIEIGTGSFNKTGGAPVSHSYTLYINYPNKETSQDVNQGARFKGHLSISDQNYVIASTANLTNASASLAFADGNNNVSFSKQTAMLSNTEETPIYSKSFSVIGNNTNLDKILSYTIKLNSTQNTFSNLTYELIKDNLEETPETNTITASETTLKETTFEGQIENDTSNYTINFYSETAGTFTGTLILNAEIKSSATITMPAKGDLIAMNIGTGLPTTFRVLKVNGTEAEVLSMSDYNVGTTYKYNDSSKTTTFSTPDGDIQGQKYEGSDLDVLMDTTIFNAMDQTVQKAIIPQTIKQSMYCYQENDAITSDATIQYYDDFSENPADSAKRGLQKKGEVIVGERKVYILDVDDVIEYFGGDLIVGS